MTQWTPYWHRLYLLMMTLALSACSSGLPPDDVDVGVPTTDAAVAPADASMAAESPAGEQVFDDSKIHTVKLTLSGSDWEGIIDEASAYENTNPKRPYYRAQLTFDGQSLAEDIGVRLKGHISIELSKGRSFPLKLDFDRYSKGMKLDGLKKLNLHTNFNGPTLPILRDHLSYGAWREFGVAASRTAFATVEVNGEALGVYVMVEQVDGGFIKRHFSAPHGDLYKPEQISGSLAYHGSSIADYPDIGLKWPDSSDHAALLHALKVLDTGSTQDIEQVFDAKAMLTYLAGNVALGSWDCYPTTGHNYYLYEATPGRFTMLPWDMNGSLEMAPHFTMCTPMLEGLLSQRLLEAPEHHKEYVSLLTSFLETAGSKEWLSARLDAAAKLLGAALPANEVEALRHEISERNERVEAELATHTGCH